MAKKKVVGDQQQELLKFLTRRRTKMEIAHQFDLSLDDAAKFLEEARGAIGEDSELIEDKNVFNASRYQIRKKIKTGPLPTRVWTYQRHADKPYIVVSIPDSLKCRKLNIVPISDVVLGSSECDMELFDKYINWISTQEEVYVFLNGDILAPVPKQGVPKEDYDPLVFAYVLAQKILSIRHKILWAQQGDDEAKMARNDGLDPLKIVCEKLDIPYFDEPVYADICWKGNVFTFFCLHGRTRAIQKGAKLNAALRPRDFQEHSMFTVMSHAGDAISKDIPRICQDQRNFVLVERSEYYLISPSFKRYFGSDAARKGYPPFSKGAISCRLYADGTYKVSS